MVCRYFMSGAGLATTAHHRLYVRRAVNSDPFDLPLRVEPYDHARSGFGLGEGLLLEDVIPDKLRRHPAIRAGFVANVTEVRIADELADFGRGHAAFQSRRSHANLRAPRGAGGERIGADAPQESIAARRHINVRGLHGGGHA